jgi:hypothetical protein
VREADRSSLYSVDFKNAWSHAFPPLNVFFGWSRERGTSRLYVSGICEFYIVHFEFLSNTVEGLNSIISERIFNEIKHTGTTIMIAIMIYRPILIIVIGQLHDAFNINMRV